MVSTLDCATLDSAIASLAILLSLEPARLVARLRDFDWRTLPVTECNEEPAEATVLRHTLGIELADLPSPDVVCWFHGTRVPAGTSFEEGLLPLDDVLPRIWDFLEQLAAPWTSYEQWRELRNSSGSGAPYEFRLQGPQRMLGPYAVLVRDILLHPDETASHDFLGVPEAVEDVCLKYANKCGHDLRQRFIDATRPCIVKFELTGATEGDTVAAAVMYVHRRLRGGSLCRSCNANYSGNGRAVPFAAISQVEWVERSESP